MVCNTITEHRRVTRHVIKAPRGKRPSQVASPHRDDC